MEWQYVCPGCGEVVERLTSLTSASSHFFCQICSSERDADLSDHVEVTFTINPDDPPLALPRPLVARPRGALLGLPLHPERRD